MAQINTSVFVFGQLCFGAACVILQNVCECELEKVARLGADGSGGDVGGVAEAVARARREIAGDI